MAQQSASIVAENTFTAWQKFAPHAVVEISASAASWAGTTAMLQRSFNGGVASEDALAIAANSPDTAAGPKQYRVGDVPVWLRIGCKTGGYGGSAVAVSLSGQGMN